MKKNYTLAALALLTCGLAVGQNLSAGKVPADVKQPIKQRHLNPNHHYTFQKNNNSNSDRSISTWVSYAESVNTNLGTCVLNQNILIADSTVLAAFGDGQGGTTYSSPFVHSLGGIFDVTSQSLKSANQIDLNKSIAYTIDSMSILYGYTRVAGSTTTDTLIVTLFNNSTASNLQTAYFTGMAANFGSDTVYIKDEGYSHTANKPVATGAVTFKLTLGWADTTELLFREKMFSTNGFNVPAGKLVGYGITYKPGMVYTLNDTLDKQVNSFIFTSYEENGASTFPTYTYCPAPNSAACDWNSSSIITTEVRYNTDPNWNGSYIPAFAYTAPYSYEDHLVSYKISATTEVGVADITNNSLSLSQNMPNPAKDVTTINYELAQSANNVVIEITDITGKQVKAFNKGKQTTGKYSVSFDGNELQAGIYFYTLKTDNSQVTKRMNVIK